MNPLRLLTLFLLLPHLLWARQNPVSITLRKDPIFVRSTTFSLDRVVDERTNSWQFGQILTGLQKNVPVRITNDVTDTFSDLLRPGFRPDSMRVPVIIRIKELVFIEKAKGEQQAEGACRLVLAFDVMRDQKPMPLTTYTARTHYTRSFDQTDRLEFVTRKALESAAQYLSDWIKVNRDKSPALVQGIKFVFVDHSIQSAAGDTVFYNPLRLLTWDDFQAEPRAGSQSAASIYPTFSYDGRSKWVNGYLQVELTFKTFMVKSMSWVRANARNDYGLRHEQSHFDIVKLIVERFKQRIAADDDMDIDDYNSRIQFLYLDAYRDMNRWQSQYDRETQHGIIQGEQERWNRKITDELRKAEELTAVMVSNRQ